MRKKLMQKWLMYHEVHRQRREEGLKPAQIARKLVMDRRTVRKYLAMSEDEYLGFIDNQLRRQKVLAFPFKPVFYDPVGHGNISIDSPVSQDTEKDAWQDNYQGINQ